MATDIGPKIGIDGEAQFRQSLKAVESQIKALGSAMKAVTAEFADNSDGMDALAAKSGVLEKSISATEQQVKLLSSQYERQVKKLADLSSELSSVTAEYGENSAEASKAQNAYNRQYTEVSKLEGQLNKAKASLASLNTEAGKTASEMGKAASASKQLSQRISDQQDEVNRLKDEYTDAVLQYGKNSKEARSLASEIKKLSKELKKNASQFNDAESAADKFDKSLDDVGDSANSAGGLLGQLSGSLKKGLAVGAIVGGIQSLVGSITSLVDKTEEYRKIMGTLETSSEAAGYTAAQTSESYRELYSVLGDTQTAATTVANLQAIGLSQEDLMEVIDSSIGAWARYGDSIPIDSLAESINETIRAGQVTGTFADVLNWGSMEGETFGVTMRESTEANAEWNESVQAAETAEDYFNLALQDCKTQAERADLVLQAMAAQGLTDTADKWKENNESIIETNQAQMEYEEAQARLAERLTPVKTALTNLATWGFDVLTKAVDGVSNALKTVSGWLDSISGRKVEASVVVKTEREVTGSGVGGKIPSHALGLDYVPYDGYIAELHKGEMVLTKAQAQLLRATPSTAQFDVGSLTTALSGSVGRTQNVRLEIPLYINGREFARATVNDLRTALNNTARSTGRGALVY